MAAAEATEPIRVPEGLYGVAVTDTRIAKSDSDGSLVYRGYAVSELFEKSSFEEAAYLVVEGRLPTRAELEMFSSNLRSRMKVPDDVFRVVENLSSNAAPMDVLRTAVSALGSIESGWSLAEQQSSIMAKMPNLVANCYRVQHRQKVTQPDEKLGYAANLLYMLTGSHPDETDSRALEQELILYMEHDLNASSFTVRVVASTQADIYAAVTAGLAALKGPLHGGANEEAMKLILQIGTPEKARAYVDDLLAKGKKIMGFGHRVYKKVDPRAQLSKGLLKRLLEQKKRDDGLYRLCDEVERSVWDAKKLPANLDFYAAPVFYLLGIPIEVYTPIFAAARIVGWVAHYNEQRAANKIIRPDAVYVGPRDLIYLPIERR
jgi:citrate synthase